MKFPKLKHTLLCAVLIYSPALMFFVFPFFGPLFSGGYDGIFIAIWILLGIFSVFYLIRNFPFFITTDITLSTIRLWKKDRLWVEFDRDGINRQSMERKLLRRIRRRGREVRSTSLVTPQPLCLCRRHAVSWTVFWSSVEKFYTLYSVGYLDADGYRSIMRAVEANAKVPPRGRMPFDKRKRKAPVASAGVVVILADRVAEEISAILRRQHTYHESCHLACVADFSVGRCYFDGMGEPYLAGMTGKPVKNMAIALLRRTVFGGRLPKRGSDNCPPEPFPDGELSVEMSLWDYIRSFREEMANGRRRDKAIYRKLKDGEVLLQDDVLYCRLGERGVSFFVETDGEEQESGEGVIEVLMEDSWEYPRRANISKKDGELLRGNIRDYLMSRGGYRRFDFS